ncbi:hypothetical protein [Paenibacillus sp. MMO-58]|uniref:hypothetical protein n=1 Tax=Paenibacillus sp. MMO-58 TaxID=3081290 RepID=UPI0030197DFC
MRTIFSLLMVAILSAMCIGCSNPNQKIKMDSPAYIYGDNFNKETEIILEGTYNKKNYNFSGSLTIGDIKFDNVRFVSSFGIKYYVGSKAMYIGQVFFDPKDERITFEVDDPDLYKQLTSKNYDGASKLVISSPAKNLEEAEQVTSELKELEMPFK